MHGESDNISKEQSYILDIEPPLLLSKCVVEFHPPWHEGHQVWHERS
jgi:hypothetical protein